MDDRLTVQELRQHLSESMPEFTQTLANALGMTRLQLKAAIEAGEISKCQAILALAKRAAEAIPKNSATGLPCSQLQPGAWQQPSPPPADHLPAG